jgi:hypothetical protein
MSKARTYLSAATLKFRPLTLPINIRQGERPDKDEHSSLFRTFVNYGGKKFYNIEARRLHDRQSFTKEATIL